MSATVEHGFELRAGQRSRRRLVRDIVASAELMRVMARKDFFVRYRRASLGLIWAVGLPLVQALILAVVFSRVVRFETSISYAAFVFAGMLPWTFFSGSLAVATTAIVDGQGIATRIYFPRAVLPLIVVGSNLYGFVPGVAVLLGMGAILDVPFGLHTLYLIPAIAVMILLTVGFSLVLSALQVYFRDTRYVLQAALLGWFWGSGVFYPLEFLGSLRRWIEMNPATGMVQLFRAGMGAADPGWLAAVWWTLGWTAALLVLSLYIHARYDRVFVDLM